MYYSILNFTAKSQLHDQQQQSIAYILLFCYVCIYSDIYIQVPTIASGLGPRKRWPATPSEEESRQLVVRYVGNETPASVSLCAQWKDKGVHTYVHFILQ